MSEKLKPCPFCWSDRIGIAVERGAGRGLHHGEDIYGLNCLECGGSVPNRYSREVIVAAWNRRELESASQPSMEKMADAMHDAAIRYANGHTVDFQHEAREFLLESASQPGGGKADGEKFRSILSAVVGEIQKDDGHYDGNAPGHAHDIPGVWDNDNGAKSGKPCSWCRTWKLARESLGLAAPSAGNAEEA